MKLFSLILLFNLTAFGLFAQDVNLSGRITNTRHQPVAGASLSLKNANYRAACDSLGNFSISIKPGNYRLEITAVGFIATSDSISISTNKHITIILTESANQLKEVNIKAGRDKTSGITRLKAVEG